MGDYRLRPRAIEDLEGIWDFTVEQWGATQAERYTTALKLCVRNLADNPELGRRCDAIREGYWRIQEGRHVIFFRREAGNLVIVERILHDRMLPGLHLAAEDDF